MSKLQQIKRANGSVIHSINIPQDIMEMIEWKKGEELEVTATKSPDDTWMLVIFNRKKF